MRVLGIESSCDDTAVAVVDSKRSLIAEARASQVNVHSRYKGVVPELAAREHVMNLVPLLNQLEQSLGASLKDSIDAIAVTRGPGLIGSLLVGTQFASGLALGWNKPLLGINHLAAHALTPRLSDGIAYPYLLLLASGGHCFFAQVNSCFDYTILGETLDDAAGEAFDKVAAMLDLGFPGGPAVEAAAKQGDAARYALPLPLQGQQGGDVSFSGLKNAVRLLVQHEQPLTEQKKADIAASFQHIVSVHLAKVLEKHIKNNAQALTIAIAGGVAANSTLRNALQQVAARYNRACVLPPPALCTDNGAMVAWCGLEWLAAGYKEKLPLRPLPRWPLSAVEGL